MPKCPKGSTTVGILCWIPHPFHSRVLNWTSLKAKLLIVLQQAAQHEHLFKRNDKITGFIPYLWHLPGRIWDLECWSFVSYLFSVVSFAYWRHMGNNARGAIQTQVCWGRQMGMAQLDWSPQGWYGKICSPLHGRMRGLEVLLEMVDWWIFDSNCDTDLGDTTPSTRSI